jgi:hypothetical protein
MRKIPTLFARDPDDMRHVTRHVNPAAKWVLDGDSIATRKFDGTCTMLDDGGRWWARREVKPGKPFPPGYVEEETDPNTGKTVGWEPIEQSSFVKAFSSVEQPPTEPGTYELVGPKVNGNPEGYDTHQLVPHGAWVLDDVPLDFDDLAEWLHAHDYEGIVWHHPDGRMAKLKKRDFPA